MVGLAATTAARDNSYLRTHVLPTFGTMALGAIDYTACQAWVNALAQRKAAATVVKAAQIMSKVMRTAVRARRIASNPMEGVKLPTIEESEDIYLTPAQVKDLADAMQQVARRYRALVLLGCYCGPRIGELAALRWSDIDLIHRSVTFARKVVEVSGHGLIEGPTKTKAGRRTVTIPRLVVAELEVHRSLVAGDLVFSGPDGGQVRANNLRRREWTTAAVAAGIGVVTKDKAGRSHYKGVTFHDMRHSAVSLWIAAGATDLEVCRWAGHRSVSFTKDRYAHLFPEHGEVLADRLDQFIASATSRPAARIVSLRR